MKSPPTKKKLQKARREGKFLKSQLLTRSTITAGSILFAYFVLPDIWVGNKILLEYVWIQGSKNPIEAAIICLKFTFFLSALLLGFGALLGVISDLAQSGMVLQPSLLAPKLERVNPGVGLRRVGTGVKESWLTLLKGITFSILLFWIIGGVFKDVARDLVLDGGASIVFLAGSSLWHLVLLSSVCLLLWGFIEYAFNRRKYYKELEMNEDEVKREYKEDEGDPYLKASRKAQHRELVVRALSEQVKRSRVIIVERA